jgi:hypothetical protein
MKALVDLAAKLMASTLLTPVGSVDLLAEVARCRYGEPTLGTQSRQWPEASCTELHADATNGVEAHLFHPETVQYGSISSA